MIRCIAVDDEPLALQQLAAYIRRTETLTLVATCRHAAEALECLRREEVDLIFTDINMPDVSGITFVRSLAEPPMVIFTTAYSEYAVEGFKLDAVDYLLKPFSYAEFLHAADKAVSLYELRRSYAAANDHPENRSEAEPCDQEYISVKADYKTTLVRISDIVYLESEGEYVRMHFNDGSTLMTLFRLKNMEKSLPADRFMRVHRSYIINLACVKTYARGRVYLNDTEYVPISINYRESFLRHVDRYAKNI